MEQSYKVIEKRYGEDRRGWLPERATWDDFEVREYADGSSVRFERECGRWASSCMCGEWRPAGELRAERLAKELEALRLNVALYFATLDNPGSEPQPPFIDAPRPSPWPQTWEQYLRDAAKKCPREVEAHATAAREAE